MSEYLLPDVGEGLTEADILTWRVAVGDVVAVNDIVVEIETAKSVVELPSPYAGEVLALLVKEGDTVNVGTPIIRIGDPSEVEEREAHRGSSAAEGRVSRPGNETPPPPPEIDLSNPAASGGGEGELLVGRVKEMVSRRRRRPGPALTDEVDGDRPLASPAVRKHARDAGVDLDGVVASGASGNVTHADIDGQTSKHSYPAVEPGRREPIKGVRRAMAQAMVASAFSAPHVTEWVTVDVSESVALADRLRHRPDFAGARVSTLLILAKACIEAIARTPIINSTWDQAAGEVVFKDSVNLGIAAATPRGLIVPNIKHAQSLTVRQLAAELKDLVDTAREGKTPPADSLGGSFTITNVGPFGVDGGTPIINPGESAILCFGAISRQPWVVKVDGEERLAIRDVCTLSLSFDHRHIDGEAGSRFLADVAKSMNDPSGLDLS